MMKLEQLTISESGKTTRTRDNRVVDVTPVGTPQIIPTPAKKLEETLNDSRLLESHANVASVEANGVIPTAYIIGHTMSHSGNTAVAVQYYLITEVSKETSPPSKYVN